MEIPSTQSAAVKAGLGASATAPVKTMNVDKPGPGQLLVKIKWSGLCGSDKGLLQDEFASINSVMEEGSKGIAGHEGAGDVVDIADDVRDLWSIGDRVGIKWEVNTCRRCEFCTNGTDELHCLKQLNSGKNWPGTFQEYCVADARHTTRILDGVPYEEAAPIMCGGVTAYVACKRSQVRPGQWVVMLGAGGGTGLTVTKFGVQYAKAMGMRVIAIDGGQDKEALCKELGAEHFIDFQVCKDLDTEIKKITIHGAHGVIVFAAAKASYEIAPMLLRIGGTQVCIGIPDDLTAMAGAHPGLIITRRLNIVGSIIGTLKDIDEAMDFTARGIVHPRLTKGRLSDIDEFMKRMGEGKIVGRAVLKIAD